MRWLALASLLLAAWGAEIAAAPPPPPSAAAIDARVDAIQALPVPAAEPGEIRVGAALDERRLARPFLETLAEQPEWRGEAIVLVSGRHRLEEVARAAGRPDLLSCEARNCRLVVPLAIESGAGLVIDGLTLGLERRSGAAIVAFGEVFISLSTIEGREGDRLAMTDGTAYRPFIVAYDQGSAVVRDSRLVSLGYDGNGTSGLSVMTTRREEPAYRPSLRLAASLIEDLFDGVFVRGADGAEIVRAKIAGTKRHGIVLRDEASGIAIAGNELLRIGTAVDNGNGIFVSRGVTGGVIAGNRIGNATGSGILVERGGADLTIAGNELAMTNRDALVVYESSGIDVLGNGITGSGRSGIRVRASDAVRLAQNRLDGSGRLGIELHDWSAMARPPHEDEAALIRPTSVTLGDNEFIGNARGACGIQGEVEVLPSGASGC